jgi:tetratricopeptide (TPR) repeat protein
MNYEVLDLTCPGCGDRVDVNQPVCKYCRKPIIVSKIYDVNNISPLGLNNLVRSYDHMVSEDTNNVEVTLSLGLCFLKLKQYDKAIKYLEKSIELDPNNSEAYFYSAIANLKGLKPFVHLRNVIDKVEEHINSALLVEEKGIYLIFLAYIKYDYFSRKFFNTTPDYQTAIELAQIKGTEELEIYNLFLLLGQSRPEKLA